MSFFNITYEGRQKRIAYDYTQEEKSVAVKFPCSKRHAEFTTSNMAILKCQEYKQKLSFIFTSTFKILKKSKIL